MKAEQARSGLERVRLLIDARKGDPLYGDRYAARAAALLQPQLSEETYVGPGHLAARTSRLSDSV